MAGIPYTALDINNRAGALVAGLWTQMEEVRRFKLWLDDSTHNDAALGPSGVGVSTADLLIIRNSFGDLGGNTGLYAVAKGTYVPAAVNNFWFNAKQLTGTLYAG